MHVVVRERVTMGWLHRCRSRGSDAIFGVRRNSLFGWFFEVMSSPPNAFVFADQKPNLIFFLFHFQILGETVFQGPKNFSNKNLLKQVKSLQHKDTKKTDNSLIILKRT